MDSSMSGNRLLSEQIDQHQWRVAFAALASRPTARG
jgi:hypothetical protein